MHTWLRTYPITSALLAAVAVVFLLQNARIDAPLALGYLWPLASPEFRPWQPITYAFFHSGLLHLLFNGVAIASMSGPLERYLGQPRFLGLLLAGVSGGAALELVVGPVFHHGPPIPSIGISGFVFSLMVAWARYWPTTPFVLLFFPLQVRTATWLAVAVEILFLITGWVPGIAHAVHLGGAAGAAVFLAAVSRSRDRTSFSNRPR